MERNWVAARLAGRESSPRHRPSVPRRSKTFEASVTRGANEWVVYFQIPWTTVGGKPGSYFGVMPIRTRWRDGEVSSPVAFDFMDEVNSTMKSGLTEDPAVDLFIETHFAGPARASREKPACAGCLPARCAGSGRAWCPIPMSTRASRSGRWRIPCPPRRMRTIWAQRLYLTSCWTDLMTMEGFCFLHRSWSATMEDLWPYIPRREDQRGLANE